jgi:hypothetical protein
MISKDKVVALFENRFDYQSARIVLAEALAKVGAAGKAGLDPDELRRIPAALAALGHVKFDALAAALGALADASGGKGKSAPAPEPEPEPEPEAAPAEEVEAPAEEEEQGGKGKKGKKR